MTKSKKEVKDLKVKENKNVSKEEKQKSVKNEVKKDTKKTVKKDNKKEKKEKISQKVDKKILSIVKEDGTMEEVDLLICFEFNDTKKEYVVYTRNEKDDNDNITIYVSSVDRSGDVPRMGAIESDEEWSRVKDVLRALSKND